MSTKMIAPLDPDIAKMERQWRESGIPGLYVGRNGPVSRERARNVRALLYPKPKLPTGSSTGSRSRVRTGRSRWRPFSRSRDRQSER